MRIGAADKRCATREDLPPRDRIQDRQGWAKVRVGDNLSTWLW